MNINLYTICVSKKSEKAIIEAKNYKDNIEDWKEKIFSGKIKAEDLYKGTNNKIFLQIRENLINFKNIEKVNHFYISAGAGIIPSTQKLLPYNASFSFESKENKVNQEWFDKINKKKIRNIPNTLNIFILSIEYIKVIYKKIPKGSLVFSQVPENIKKILKEKNISIFDLDLKKRLFLRKFLKTGDTTLNSKYFFYILSLLEKDKKEFNKKNIEEITKDFFSNLPQEEIDKEWEKELKRKTRLKIKDEELINIIKKLNKERMSKNKILPYIRNELGFKVGSQRFERIYKKTI